MYDANDKTGEIRSYIIGSPKRGVELAAELGVSQTTITNVRNGKSWKHLPRPPKIDRRKIRS